MAGHLDAGPPPFPDQDDALVLAVAIVVDQISHPRR